MYASEAQAQFLRDLIATREWQVRGWNQEQAEAMLTAGTLGKAEASALIDALRQAPRKATGAVAIKGSTAGLSEGMYRSGDGNIYRVQASRESGRLYAKRLVWDLARDDKPRFEYDRGAVYALTPADRMSVEDARAWGVETGACCVCGAFLTDAKSVARGIGPVCEGRV